MDELFSKLKSSEVDRGLRDKGKEPTDSHSLALVSSCGDTARANLPTRQFVLSALVSLPDEEFDVLSEEDLALLTRRFERLTESRVLRMREAWALSHRVSGGG